MSACDCKPAYPDKAWHGSAEVIENVQLAIDTYRIRLVCPELAAHIVPGQFVMLRLSGTDDPLLGRPLAMYESVLNDAGEPWALDVVYLVIGKMTGRLAAVRTGEPIEVWGPLGNGFPNDSVDHLIMVAGGIGQTPFLALGQEALGRRSYGNTDRQAGHAKRVTLCYGARTEGLLAGIPDFDAVGIDVQVATDDGSTGHHGLGNGTDSPPRRRNGWHMPNRLLRARAHAESRYPSGPAIGCALPGIARDSHGLRHGDLL